MSQSSGMNHGSKLQQIPLVETPIGQSVQQTLDKLNLIGLVIENDGNISYINEFTKKTLGWTLDEIKGRDFFEVFVPKPEQKNRREAFEKALINGGVFEHTERTFLTKSGQIRNIQMNTTIISTEDEHVAALSIIGEDVTERKATADALGRSNALLQDLVDNTTDLIQISNLDGRFLFVNKSWLETLRYESSDLASLNIKEVIHPDFLEITLDKFRRIENGEKIPDFETVFRRKDGRRIYLTGSVNARLENDVPVAFRCIFHNSTSKVRAERAQNLYYSIAQATIQSPNLEEFYKNIHQKLGELIDVKNFFIAQYDPATSYLFFPYYIDEYFDSRLHFTKRRLGNGLTEYAIKQNKPLMLTDEDIHQLAENKDIYIYNEVPKVMLCVPLRVDGKVTGIIGVKSYERQNKYDIRDLELLEFISGQIAVAIARKQAEDVLNKQTARLNAIFDSSSHIMWSVNRRLLLTSFNQNYGELMKNQLSINPQLNYSTEKFGFRLVGASNRKVLEDKYREAFKGESKYFEVHLDSEINDDMWLEVHLNPIMLADGTIEEVAGIARDITDKKNAELALQESEGKFRDIFESFQDIYCRTNMNSDIVMVSPSVLQSTGFTVDEVLGKNMNDFFVDNFAAPERVSALIKLQKVSNFEARLKAKSGEMLDYMLNMRVIYNENNEPEAIEGVARDITELKKASREYQKAKEDAERSLKVKESFLANMSHEIRTPMNGVIGMIDLLNETELDTDQKDYVQTIKRSSQTLLNILNDILDLSKIEAGKMELHEAPIATVEIFDKLKALFSQVAQQKNNSIQIDLSDKIPEFIIADETRLLQILSNLTSNALKFTENGTVSIKADIIEKKGKFNTFKIEVTDTGIGISDENLKVLFNAFSQIDNSTKKSYGGTGLGLAISKELCRLMKGNIGVHSVSGKGSTFWFTVVIKETSISPLSKVSTSETFTIKNYFGQNNPSILLVDDNAVNRKVASEILKKAGCKVEQASSGQEAIAMIADKNTVDTTFFEIILMDIQMPDLDGIETTKILRKNGLKLPPIMAMTAYSMKEDRARFIANGMDDYIPKPIRAQTLLEKINEWIQKHSKQDQQNANLNISIVETSNSKNHVLQNKDIIGASEPIFDMEVINQLAELAGPEMVHSVLEEFENEAKEQIQNTIDGAKNEDWKTVKSELHTLKGNAGTLGIARLHSITKHIELKAKVDDFEYFFEEIKILEAEFVQFQNQYKFISLG